MRSFLLLSATLGATCAFAGVYDDCAFLFRGTYPWKSTASEKAVVEEFANALIVGNGTPETESNWGIAGAKREYVNHLLANVVCPYSGRVLKNRNVLYLAQHTYENAQGVLCGYSNRVQFYAPFSSNFTNAYSIVMRYRHDGKMSDSSTETCLFNFGHNWNNNRGMSVYLMGDDDNQTIRIFQGRSYNVTFDLTSSSEDTKLKAGKWVDLAICRNNDTPATSTSLCLYTCVEGGKWCKQTGYANGSAATDTAAGNLVMLSTGEATATQSCNGNDNVPVTDASMKDKFRGAIQKFAMWKRKLSDEEVEAAFCEDMADGELVRLGVDNGNSLEFTGVNAATGAAVAETDADQGTDWRYFNATLTSASPTATVKFTAGADHFVGHRTLNVKATADSCASATMSAVLNGKTIADSMSLTAGGVLQADVAWQDLKIGENTLVLTRTDAGVDPVKVDCLYLGDFAEQGQGGAQTVPGDVYSGALGWHRHATDVNGDGWFDNMKDYPNFLLARDEFRGDQPDVSQYWGRTVASNYQVHVVNVVNPASGAVLENEECVYFRTLVWTNESSQVQNVHGAIYHNVAQILDNPSNFTVLARMKIDSLPNPVAASMMGVGFTGNKGVGLDVRPENGDMENLRPYVWKGNAVSSPDATLTGDASDRLAVGKWIDYAISVSNHTVRFYTCVEGGTGLIEQEAGSTKNCDAMATANVAFGKYDVSTGNPGTGLPSCFRGWLHNAAVWGRALGRDEILKAMMWPRPDIVRLGVADKTVNEFDNATVSSYTVPANADFAAGSPAVISPGGSYTVTFDIPAGERSKNQLLKLHALDSGTIQPIGVSVNGMVVTNLSDAGVATFRFSPDANGMYEAGISRKWLKDGENTVSVFVDADATSVVRVDSMVVGNGGERVRVRTGDGLVVLVR